LNPEDLQNFVSGEDQIATVWEILLRMIWIDSTEGYWTVTNKDRICRLLLANANYTACQTSTCVSSRLAKLMSAISQVIFIGMDHDCSSQNAQVARQWKLLIHDVDFGSSFRIRDDISQIACMSCVMSWSSVSLSVGVKVGTCWHTAVGCISKLVNMEPVQSWFQTGDFSRYLNCISFSLKANEWRTVLIMTLLEGRSQVKQKWTNIIDIGEKIMKSNFRLPRLVVLLTAWEKKMVPLTSPARTQTAFGILTDLDEFGMWITRALKGL
jgi:hypothetical protein